MKISKFWVATFLKLYISILMIFKMLYKALILKVFPSSIVHHCQTFEIYHGPFFCYSLCMLHDDVQRYVHHIYHHLMIIIHAAAVQSIYRSHQRSRHSLLLFYKVLLFLCNLCLKPRLPRGRLLYIYKVLCGLFIYLL